MADEGGQDGEEHNISADFYHYFKGIHHNSVKRGLCSLFRPVCVILRVKSVCFAGKEGQREDGQVQGQKEGSCGGRGGRGRDQSGGCVA